jgi:Protein phosphatase 2C
LQYLQSCDSIFKNIGMKNFNIECLFAGKTQKAQENPEDCQDAFHVKENLFAIADGATQSFFPGIWSDLLVKHFCEVSADMTDVEQWLKPVQAAWLTQVQQLAKQTKKAKTATWIQIQNQISRRTTAAATFVGVEFTDDHANCTLIGDSCVFTVKGEQVESWLLQKSVDFTTAPEFLGSYPNRFKPTFHSIPLESDMYVLLATDALAEWILKCQEEDESKIREILQIANQEGFENFVEVARKDSNLPMKNDDVTLIILKISKVADTSGEGIVITPNSTTIGSSDTILAETSITSVAGKDEIKNDNQSQDTKNDNEPIEPNSTLLDVIKSRFAPKIEYSEVAFKIMLQEKTIFKTTTALLTVLCAYFYIFWTPRTNAVAVVTPIPALQADTNTIISLQKGTEITDAHGKPVFVKPLATDFKVVNMGNNKFKIDLFVHKTAAQLQPNYINIKAGGTNNLRNQPAYHEIDNLNIFGVLRNDATFPHDADYIKAPAWDKKSYKFTFTGYFKK